jgi:cell division protease FtsH
LRHIFGPIDIPPGDRDAYYIYKARTTGPEGMLRRIDSLHETFPLCDRDLAMNNDRKNVQRPAQSWMPWIWILLLWVLIFYFFTPYSKPADSLGLTYSDFRDYVNQGKVTEATIKGDRIKGTFKEPVTLGTKEKPLVYKSFDTTMPPFAGSQVLELLEKNHVVIRALTTESSWVTTLVVGLLPWVLIIGFFVYSSKKLSGMGGIGGNPFQFGKSKARLYTKSSSNITFEDVAGLANAKKEFAEIVDFLKDPGKYRKLGGKLPKGVLLAGPPGTGKTLMARAVAGEASVPFFSISGSEFIEMFVGVGASRVRDMFENAKKDAPAIIFIDEIDSIGRVRGTGLGGGHDEREQTLNQILAEMDGFSPSESIIVMAATNRPDILDPALVRPGRFDRRITLDLPQKQARKEILQIHARKVTIGEDVNFELVAEMTVGFSGADLMNLVNEAALLAARKGKNKVEAVDFEESRDKIIMGIEREDLINEDEKKAVAYHEAGHALLAKLLPGVDPLQKVTIIPRGHALGATEQIPEEDRHNMSRTYLLNRVAILLGGRVAEKMVFKDITTGAGDDLKKATQIARRMVCQWGMSDRLGAVTFPQGQEYPFLGREITEPRDFSEYTARIIDEEVQKIVQEMEQRAEEYLKPHKDKLDLLASALLKHETLDNKEVDEIIGSNLIEFRTKKKKGSESEDAGSGPQA